MHIKLFAFVLVAGLTGCASFHSMPSQDVSNQNDKRRIVHNQHNYPVQNKVFHPRHKVNDANDIPIQNLMA